MRYLALLGLILLLALAACTPSPGTIDAMRLYSSNCAGCHGSNFEGGSGPSWKTSDFIRDSTVEQVAAVIRDGRENTSMPSFANDLTVEQILALAQLAKQVRMMGN